jgi:hypothetical protein
MEKQKRRAARYPFTAHAELIPENSTAGIKARIKELSLYGCYLEDTSPLPTGTHVTIKIVAGSDFFEAAATVVFSQPNIGMGVVFREVRPHFLPLLRKWLLAAMQQTNTEAGG